MSAFRSALLHDETCDVWGCSAENLFFPALLHVADAAFNSSVASG